MLKICFLRKIMGVELFLTALLSFIAGAYAMPRQTANTDALAQSAIQMIQKGEFTEAQQMLETELHRSPNEVALWNLLGVVRTELHDNAKARNAFEHGLRLAPNSISLNENTGLLFFKEADYRNAKKYLMKAVEKGSQSPGVRFSLAASRLRTGEPAKALEELKSLEAQLSGSSDYWEERGRAEMLTDAPAAETDFIRAIDLNPKSLVALNGAATVGEKRGLDEKALAYLIRARQINPNDVPTLTHFGEVCIRRDLGLDAKDALEEALKLEPSNNTALFLLARANISLQNWQKAIDLFAEFARREPNVASTYYAMAWVDLRLNQRDEARQLLEKCLKLQPDLADARVELAQLMFDDGQLQEAEGEVKTALQTDSKNAKGNQLMGDLLLRHGKIDEAQSRLEEAIKTDPNSPAAHYKLAAILSRKRQMEKASQERALAATLAEESRKQSKTQLRLVLPDSGVTQ